jgi:hypothetical protein
MQQPAGHVREPRAVMPRRSLPSPTAVAPPYAGYRNDVHCRRHLIGGAGRGLRRLHGSLVPILVNDG